jgi:MoaA/NifB/PqqE/SkfB family radical SAM enzyme
MLREASEAARRRLNLLTGRLHSVPLLVLMPHSRCNARCVMCDIWKANADKRELSREQIARMLPDLRALRVQRVVLSGGEALLHPNLWALAELIVGLGARITLLSTGLTLDRHAADVVRWCDEVVVSLDGSPAIHDAIRNVPGAYDRLAAGVRALKRLTPSFRVTGRCVLQRRNVHDLSGVVQAAKDAGLDRISFLAVDVSSPAFNRLEVWGQDRVADAAPTWEQVVQLRGALERLASERAGDFARGFIAEPVDKLQGLVRYFEAVHGRAEFVAPPCNAPWMSAVVEADGVVRPCFFLPPLGDLGQGGLAEVLNSDRAIRFRRELEIDVNPTCRRCVCSLSVGLRSEL